MPARKEGATQEDLKGVTSLRSSLKRKNSTTTARVKADNDAAAYGALVLDPGHSHYVTSALARQHYAAWHLLGPRLSFAS